MKALLLCAGRGSRLHPYTRNCSKVCLPFLNLPIAAYPLKLLEDLGVSRLLVNTHHQAQQVQNVVEFLTALPEQSPPYFKKQKAGKANLQTANMRFAAEQAPPRSASKPNLFEALPSLLSVLKKSGTQNRAVIPAQAGIQNKILPSFSYEPNLLEGLGTLRKNSNFFKNEENIIYLNGDSVFLCGDFFPQMLSQHKQKKALMTFLCSPFQKGASYLWTDKEGRIISKEKAHGSCFFAGFALVSHECFSLFKKSDNHLFRDFVYRHSDRCFAYMQKDLKFFELGSLSHYMKSLQICVKYLEAPLSKEGKILNKILKRYLPAEFLQNPDYLDLNSLRRQFFSPHCLFITVSIIDKCMQTF